MTNAQHQMPQDHLTIAIHYLRFIALNGATIYLIADFDEFGDRILAFRHAWGSK